MKTSKINFYIFAMRILLANIVFHIQSLFTYHKGIVPHSFYSNVQSEVRTSRTIPSFFKVNYFLMRTSENNLQQTHKVCSAVTSVSRNETNPILFLQNLYANGKAKLFTITANARYCYVRFKTTDNTFLHARSTTIADACTSIINKLPQTI